MKTFKQYIEEKEYNPQDDQFHQNKFIHTMNTYDSQHIPPNEVNDYDGGYPIDWKPKKGSSFEGRYDTINQTDTFDPKVIWKYSLHAPEYFDILCTNQFLDEIDKMTLEECEKYYHERYNSTIKTPDKYDDKHPEGQTEQEITFSNIANKIGGRSSNEASEFSGIIGYNLLKNLADNINELGYKDMHAHVSENGSGVILEYDDSINPYAYDFEEEDEQSLQNLRHKENIIQNRLSKIGKVLDAPYQGSGLDGRFEKWSIIVSD